MAQCWGPRVVIIVMWHGAVEVIVVEVDGYRGGGGDGRSGGGGEGKSGGGGSGVLVVMTW